MIVLLVALGLFVLGGVLHWWGVRDCERSYQKEIAYWQGFQLSIKAERVELGRKWAAEDLQLVARGHAPHGMPRFTPWETQLEYNRLMDEAPLPVEVPAWKTTKVPELS